MWHAYRNGQKVEKSFIAVQPMGTFLLFDLGVVHCTHLDHFTCTRLEKKCVVEQWNTNWTFSHTCSKKGNWLGGLSVHRLWRNVYKTSHATGNPFRLVIWRRSSEAAHQFLTSWAFYLLPCPTAGDFHQQNACTCQLAWESGSYIRKTTKNL